ncbi:hypothetical protein V2G26_021149 [Clonostachys chloroleuca]
MRSHTLLPLSTITLVLHLLLHNLRTEADVTAITIAMGVVAVKVIEAEAEAEEDTALGTEGAVIISLATIMGVIKANKRARSKSKTNSRNKTRASVSYPLWAGRKRERPTLLD